jgi:hypothetical protein
VSQQHPELPAPQPYLGSPAYLGSQQHPELPELPDCAAGVLLLPFGPVAFRLPIVVAIVFLER